MIDRREIKERGKSLMQQYYIKSVVFGLVLMICVALGRFSMGGGMSVRSIYRMLRYGMSGFFSIFAILGLFGMIASFAIRIFLLKPLELGCRRYFVDCSFHDVDFEVAIDPFYSNYQNIVKVMFFRELYIWLWGMLFCIPGVIKRYEYRMVPYLLLENPDMDEKEALKRSKDMMMGHKKEAFLFDCSFMGWYVVSAFTLGMAGVFYVNPYKACSDAQYYLAVRSMYRAQNAQAVHRAPASQARVYS